MIHIDVRKKLFNSYGDFFLDICADVQEERLLAVFGESGSGKTTLLRMLGGLTSPDEGRIEVGGKVWFDSSAKINLPAQQRQIGFVFQDYSLFPHMSVRENLGYALNKNKDEGIIDDLLDFAELGELAYRRPQSLSGGQQQRVALIRAIVRRPKILLLDEPLSALDSRMRIRLQDLILKISQRFQLTTFLVTHEMAEVFKLTDEVFILNDGKIVNRGEPRDVFLQKKISGKFRCSGDVIAIDKADIVNIVCVRAGNQVVRVIASDEEIRNISVGDQVLVASKAFSPVMSKTGVFHAQTQSSYSTSNNF